GWGERIRDKIAASKAKGMWMGGRVPLGYDVRDRKLEIVEGEAETVRHIFRRYAELGSVFDLREDLADCGIVTKRQVWSSGRVVGGIPFGRGPLYHLLQNQPYRGEISHKGTIHPGQHQAIVDRELWDRVQSMLAENRVERTVRIRAASPSLLAGIVHDEDGIPLTPTHANKKGRRYRYYVSLDLITGRKQVTADRAAGEPDVAVRHRSSARRIPATDLEAIVERRLTEFLGDAPAIDAIVAPRARDIEERRLLVERAGDLAETWPNHAPPEKIASLQRLVKTIIVTAESVDIALRADAVLALARIRAKHEAPHRGLGRRSNDDDDEIITLSVPATLKRVGMEMRHLVDAPEPRGARKPNRSLLRLVAHAQRFRDLLTKGDGRSVAELATECNVGPSYFARILRLGFLAPDITSAILDGRQPIELSAQKLSKMNLPKDWAKQRQVLGFSQSGIPR
ncbi:MAG: recombinase family protein, partial [Ancalomicrobiaceae bacterium]|nr:recombinase family protein [Ancalomicrobiaceae bacterium]